MPTSPSLFFSPQPPTPIYTLSLHDALPISRPPLVGRFAPGCGSQGKRENRARKSDARDHHLPKLLDRKSTRLNSSHTVISYAVFCLKKKKPSHPRNVYAICNDSRHTYSPVN